MASPDGAIGVVIDAGSQLTKAGFASEAFPRAVFPTTVGRFRRQGLLDGFPDIYCGQEAIEKRGVSRLTWPVQEGFIHDWEEMEKLWHHTFYKELHMPPEEAKILHAVHPLVKRGDRERMAEILFETFAVHGLKLVKDPVLVLHASGRTTGVVYENGFSCSYVAPIFEGFPLKQATTCTPLTGEALTARLHKLLANLGYSFTTPIERDLVDKIKAELCYVASNYDDEIKKHTSCGENHVRYELPDGQHILLGPERFQCPEILFQPSLENYKCPNIVDNICSSIDMCDLDYKSLFYGNIVASGGSSMFPGLVNRILQEVTLRTKQLPGIKANVEELRSRQFAAWAGGSILASLECLKGFWMTKREYEDVGPDCVNLKFF